MVVVELVAEFRLVLFAVLLGAHGVVEQAFDGIRIGWIEAYADMTFQVDRVAVDIDGLVDHVHEPLYRPGHLFFLRDIVEQHRELVAGHA